MTAALRPPRRQAARAGVAERCCWRIREGYGVGTTAWVSLEYALSPPLPWTEVAT